MVTPPPTLPIPVPNTGSPGGPPAQNATAEGQTFARTLAQTQTQTPPAEARLNTGNPQETSTTPRAATPEGSTPTPTLNTSNLVESQAASAKTDALSSPVELSLVAAITLPVITLPVITPLTPVLPQAPTEQIRTEAAAYGSENAPNRADTGMPSVTAEIEASAPTGLPVTVMDGTTLAIPAAAQSIVSPVATTSASPQIPTTLEFPELEFPDAPVDSHANAIVFASGAGIVSSSAPSVSASFVSAPQPAPGELYVTPQPGIAGANAPETPPVPPLLPSNNVTTPIAEETAQGVGASTPDQANPADATSHTASPANRTNADGATASGAKGVRLETLDRWLTVGTPPATASDTKVSEASLPPVALQAAGLAETTKDADAPLAQTASLSGTAKPDVQIQNASANARLSAEASLGSSVIAQPAAAPEIRSVDGNAPAFPSSNLNLAGQTVALANAQNGTLLANPTVDKTAMAPTNTGVPAVSFEAAVVQAVQQTETGDTGAQTQDEANPADTPDFDALLQKTEATPRSSGEQAASPVTHRAEPTTEATNITRATPSGFNSERLSVMEQVSRHLETMRLTNGRGEISMQLHPDTLGSVHVTISTRPEGMVAVIVAETSQAQQAMESAKEHLRAALENRGLRLSALDVNVGQQTPNGSHFGFAGRFDTPQERNLAAYGRRRSPVVNPMQETVAPVAAASSLPSLRSRSRLDYRA